MRPSCWGGNDILLDAPSCWGGRASRFCKMAIMLSPDRCALQDSDATAHYETSAEPVSQPPAPMTPAHDAHAAEPVAAAPEAAAAEAAPRLVKWRHREKKPPRYA